MQRHRFVRARTCGIVGFLACLVVGFGVWKTSSTRAKQYAELLSQDAQSAPVVRDEETELRIEAFCGDCHAMPRAESIPRDAWHDAVVAGYTYYARSGRNDLEPPPMHAAVAYYRSRAPEQLVFSKPDKAATELGTTFVVENLPFEPVDNIPPANSHLRWTRLDPDADPVLLTCDFRYGGVAAVALRKAIERAFLEVHPWAAVQPKDASCCRRLVRWLGVDWFAFGWLRTVADCDRVTCRRLRGMRPLPCHRGRKWPVLNGSSGGIRLARIVLTQQAT